MPLVSTTGKVAIAACIAVLIFAVVMTIVLTTKKQSPVDQPVEPQAVEREAHEKKGEVPGNQIQAPQGQAEAPQEQVGQGTVSDYQTAPTTPLPASLKQATGADYQTTLPATNTIQPPQLLLQPSYTPSVIPPPSTPSVIPPPVAPVITDTNNSDTQADELMKRLLETEKQANESKAELERIRKADADKIAEEQRLKTLREEQEAKRILDEANAKEEAKRLEAERKAEEDRIRWAKEAEAARTAAAIAKALQDKADEEERKRLAEIKRIADEAAAATKAAEEKRIAEEKAAEDKRIAAEKAAQKLLDDQKIIDDKATELYNKRERERKQKEADEEEARQRDYANRHPNYQTWKHKKSGKCLDSNGNAVYTGKCNANNQYQQWRLFDGGLQHRASGKCLVIMGDGYGWNEKCELGGHKGYYAFKYTEQKGLRNDSTGRCIDGNKDGNIITWPCNGADTQTFDPGWT